MKTSVCDVATAASSRSWTTYFGSVQEVWTEQVKGQMSFDDPRRLHTIEGGQIAKLVAHHQVNDGPNERLDLGPNAVIGQQVGDGLHHGQFAFPACWAQRHWTQFQPICTATSDTYRTMASRS